MSGYLTIAPHWFLVLWCNRKWISDTVKNSILALGRDQNWNSYVDEQTLTLITPLPSPKSWSEVELLNLGCSRNRIGNPNTQWEVTSLTLSRDRTTSTAVSDCTFWQWDPVLYFLNLKLTNHAIMTWRHVFIFSHFETCFWSTCKDFKWTCRVICFRVAFVCVCV